jgi:hypothetical protein
MNAAVVYEKTGHPEKQKLMMEAAGKLVEELGAARYRDSVQCHWCRARFFDRGGNDAAARREWEEMVRLKSYDVWFWQAQELIRAGDLAGAIALANDARRKPIKMTQYAVPMILAESDPKLARALNQTAATRQTGRIGELWPPLVLCLLGDRAEAEKAWRALRQRKPHWRWRGGWYERLLDFDCGDIAAQQLLARAGTSQLNQCEANFYVAMKYLADGDRAQARKHFQASVDTGVFLYIEYQWSRIFLARMDQDPNWPRWIPNAATQPWAP